MKRNALRLALAASLAAGARHFLLDDKQRRMRFVCGLDGIKLGEGATRSEVTITRTGSFSDPRYGRFDITRDMLLSMVRNFEAGTYGQDIFIDVSHEPDKGAAAKVLALKVDGQRLRAEVAFTPYGVSAVKERGFQYLSAEFVDNYVDNEQGKSHGPTLLGAGLTTRPVIKRLDPVTLSEAGAPQGPVFLHPELIRSLSEHLERTVMNWLDKLRADLAALKLSEATITSILAAAKEAAKNLGEDAAALKALSENFLAAGKSLAESGNAEKPIQITVNAPAAGGGKVLSEEDVRKLLAEEATKRETEAKKLADTKAARVKVFTDAIEAAAKTLSEDTRKELAAAADLITAEMTEDQVKRLAATQLALGEKLEASRKLGAMGFARPVGSVHISVDDSNAIKSLAESVKKGLRQIGNDRLRLAEPDKLSPFVQKVLAEFDARNAEALHREAKMLSGGTVNISDTSLPASYQRQVIEETYQDLNILALVNASVDPTQAATHNIPYETRDTSGVLNDGITYEGQAIQQAGVAQHMDLAYIEPRKLALELSNEVIFFTRQNGLINWDAWARNIASNSRLMRELVARSIANRMQRESDAYSVTTVAAGTATTAYTGATNGYKTASYPVVRPRQVRDLQGTAIGAVQNPITFKDGATVLSEYDGTNTQAAGKYYKVISYNLGLFQVVSELGVATAPAGAVTIGYDYTTNVVKVDTDTAGGSTYEKQMNKILQAIGSRKAVLSGDRYVQPNFLLLSDALHNMTTDAEQFSNNFVRADASINAAGNLQPVKGIQPVTTNAPNIDLGDERILLGERGAMSYTVAKVFGIGEPAERVDSNGKFIGKKGAYGEEYSSIHVPLPLRSRFTSVLAYSYTNARGA